MALEFKDWGLSPEESVASRKKALDAFTNIAQPMDKERQAMERGKLASDAYAATAQAAKAGDTQGVSDILAKAQGQAAELIPQQESRAQDLAFQGAMQREDILGAKQNKAVANYERSTAEYKDKAATQLANKAFQMGYDSKVLALSMNAYLADRGLQQMYADLQAGRISTQEVRELGIKLHYQAQQKKAEIDIELKKLQGELQTLIAQKDFAAAKDRIEQLTKKAQEAAEMKTKGSMMGSILSGAFTLGGAFVGGWFGGPAGAAAGAKGGELAADAITG